VGTTVAGIGIGCDEVGKVHAGHGYTRLHITFKHVLKIVDGLLTGLHRLDLDLLTAFLPAAKIHSAYEEAVQRRVHEFEDLNLIV